MALFKMRDSWNVWRRKVDEALGGSVEPVKSEDVVYDNTDSGLTATNVQSAIDEVVSGIGGDVDTLKTFNTNIPDGYLFMGREMISDTVENGTFAGCLDTIATHLKTVAHALEDDEIIIVDALILAGNASFIVRNDAYTNQSTDTNFMGMAVAATSTTYYLWNFVAYSGTETSTMQHMTYNGGTWTFSDDSSASSGASKVVECYYKKFKKIK